MENSTPLLQCGFIGLGSQGAPMARRMIDAGFPTTLWARREESYAPYRDSAARFAPDVESLGRSCDHIGLCVVNDNDVREIAGRLLPVMKADAVLAIHSTIHPDTARAVAHQGVAHNVRVLDAPVSGGEPAAKAGRLTVMVGGDADTLELARRVFESFATLIVRVGDVGAGQLVKLINNSLLIANMGLADAALAAGSNLGLEKDSLVQLLQASSGRSFALDVRARMESPAGFRHGGALLRKDLSLLQTVLGPDDPAARCISDAAERFLQAATQDV
jgi:3-hydroxyisobutyrate dehydrogenase